MGQTIAQKIIAAHLVDGKMEPGCEVGLRIDQTLTQDATGTMAYLEYEAMGIPRVRTELSVAYIDHNTLQSGFDERRRPPFHPHHRQKDRRALLPPGQRHLPSGASGTLRQTRQNAHRLRQPHAYGGRHRHALPWARAVWTWPWPWAAARIISPIQNATLVKLSGALRPMVSAKDVILEVLRVMSVKGGVGKIVEYGGEGVKNLTVPQRATITNMGAELGATTSIFPSDEVTHAFLKAQGREEDYMPLAADADAVYDEVIEIDLSALEPLAACPHSPDNVKPVRSLAMTKVDQVCIGSCTNSSYADLMTVAEILKGKTVSPEVSLAIAPGCQPGAGNAERERRADRPAGRGRAHSGMRLRPLHRHGPKPQLRRAFPCARSTATSRAAAARGTPAYTL